jgi:hypothetical protein
MNAQSPLSPGDVERFSRDPHSMASRSKNEMFSLTDAQRHTIQLAGLRMRLAELAPKLSRLRALAEDNRITGLDDINAVVPLLFAHTECKSYPMSLIDNCRFDLLNDWLDGFTTHDLSRLDVSRCRSIDEWLDVVETSTPVRVLTSSGTSGKVSLIPRSVIEEKYFADSFRFVYQPFRGERGLKDVYAQHVHHVFPYARYGRHVTCLAIRAMVEHGFGGDDSHVMTFGGTMSTDVLWMSGRLKKAQAEGTVEQLKKTKSWQRLCAKLDEYDAQRTRSLQEFFKDVVIQLRDKTIVVAMGLNYFLDMIESARQNGLDMRFAPDSILTAAGGLKGVTLTQGQIDKVRDAFPQGLNEFYACSEIMSGLAQKCPEGHFHPPPWQVVFVVDPDTGVPYPREGVRTGRYAGFDLWATTYWGGFITGDEVTVNWDGGCACGRTGHYFQGTIVRYSDKRGGDDKITCQRTAGAVQEMLEHMRAEGKEPA